MVIELEDEEKKIVKFLPLMDDIFEDMRRSDYNRKSRDHSVLDEWID